MRGAIDMLREVRASGGRLRGGSVRCAVLLAVGLLVLVGAGASAAMAATPRWVHLRPNATPPPAAEDPLAYDAATGQMLLLDSVNGGTWTWDGATWAPQTPSTSPSARINAVMAYDDATKQLILFGGQTGPNLLNETWSWTGSNWVRLSPVNSPPALDNASLAYDAATGQLLLFGGNSGFGPGSDTWSWDGSTWTQLHPATSPPARDQAPMAYDPATSQLLLFGGASDETPLGDTWSWTGSDWTKLNPTASPSPRVAPALAYDSATQQLLLQGGVGGTGLLNDQWAWSGSRWVKQRQLSAVTPAREGRAMAYDPATAELVLFGGGTNSSANLGDTWVWTPLRVQTASLTEGAVGVRYSATLAAISGTAPYTWSVSGGALPAGLTLSPAGVISGTPTTAGTSTFTVTALDAAQPTPIAATRVFSIQVFAAPQASVWVGNGLNSEVNAFSLRSTGNAAPMAVVSGPNTGLVTPGGIALDSTGRLYVTETAANTVAIFPAGATGNTPPLATISGPDTGLATPIGITLNGGKIWVSDESDNSLTAYPVTASGDTAPSLTIRGSATQLSAPTGLGVDGKGNLLVANFYGAAVLKFAPAGPLGDVAPTAVIGGAAAQLSSPQAVDSDAAGRIYVASENGGLNVFTSTATTPTAIINGSATRLRAPGSVAVAPPLNLTTRSMPRAALGRRYAQRLYAILGQAPLRWRMVHGHLPPGLKLRRSGRVTGIASELGRFHLTVSVRDSERNPQTAQARVTLIVARRPTVTGVKRSRGSRRGGATVTITGTGFATARGVTAVSFGRMRALRVRCRSSVRCTMRTPASRRGVVAVTVSVRGLTSQRSPRANYRFTR